jgi:hypothetical protein
VTADTIQHWPAPHRMLVGSDAHTIDLHRYPHLAYARRFAGPNLPRLDDVPAQVTPHVSMAVMQSRKTLDAWFTANAHRRGFLTLKHEVNSGKKGTTGTFRAEMRRLRKIRDDHEHGRNWQLVEIYGLWAQLHKTPGWDAYTSGVADALAFDCYVPAGATEHPDPVAFFAPAVHAARAAGLPLMIPELGCLPMAYDPDQVHAAAWYTACADYLRSINCLALAVWDSPRDGSYVLTGNVLEAWQKVVAEQ